MSVGSLIEGFLVMYDFTRKYYSIDRAKKALGYEPQDNSAEWQGDEKVVGPDA
jgi:NAD+ dependent glucose-6-phosphate dehydrogenase